MKSSRSSQQRKEGKGVYDFQQVDHGKGVKDRKEKRVSMLLPGELESFAAGSPAEVHSSSILSFPKSIHYSTLEDFLFSLLCGCPPIPFAIPSNLPTQVQHVVVSLMLSVLALPAFSELLSPSIAFVSAVLLRRFLLRAFPSRDWRVQLCGFALTVSAWVSGWWSFSRNFAPLGSLFAAPSLQLGEADRLDLQRALCFSVLSFFILLVDPVASIAALRPHTTAPATVPKSSQKGQGPSNPTGSAASTGPLTTAGSASTAGASEDIPPFQPWQEWFAVASDAVVSAGAVSLVLFSHRGATSSPPAGILFGGSQFVAIIGSVVCSSVGLSSLAVLRASSEEAMAHLPASGWLAAGIWKPAKGLPTPPRWDPAKPLYAAGTAVTKDRKVFLAAAATAAPPAKMPMAKYSIFRILWSLSVRWFLPALLWFHFGVSVLVFVELLRRDDATLCLMFCELVILLNASRLLSARSGRGGITETISVADSKSLDYLSALMALVRATTVFEFCLWTVVLTVFAISAVCTLSTPQDPSDVPIASSVPSESRGSQRPENVSSRRKHH